MTHSGWRLINGAEKMTPMEARYRKLVAEADYTDKYRPIGYTWPIEELREFYFQQGWVSRGEQDKEDAEEEKLNG